MIFLNLFCECSIGPTGLAANLIYRYYEEDETPLHILCDYYALGSKIYSIFREHIASSR